MLDSFARYFGSEAEAERPRLPRQVWAADPWSRGCYVGYMPPGRAPRLPERVREPVGRIHWAGTETATEWAGYMDGAIESGQRAAAEVLAAL